MTLGESVRLIVGAAGDSGLGCAPTVESVTWASSNATVASLTPLGRTEAWITGAALGEAAISARVVFKDSPPQEVVPRIFVSSRLSFSDVPRVSVVAPPAPSQGAVRILHGTASLAGYTQGGSSFRTTVPFVTSVEGHLDVTVDWSQWGDHVDVVVAGPCPGACIVISRSTSERVKPLHLERSRLPPASYTLRIDNGSAEPEAVSYEVWLTPGG
jgi:hypothetical protein